MDHLETVELDQATDQAGSLPNASSVGKPS